MMRCKHYLSKGIGLLELMLSLAIIAILLIMATRYYQSASDSQKISQAVDMFAALKGAAKNYYHSQTPPTYATSVAQLVAAGYLPASYLDNDQSGAASSNASPWNTSIAVAGGAGFVTVTMHIPSGNICNQVLSRLNSTLSTAAGEKAVTACTGSNPDYTLAIQYSSS